MQTVKTWRDGFPDFHFKLEDVIVQGNKIVLRIPFTGTHLGRFWGVKPTGRKINITEGNRTFVFSSHADNCRNPGRPFPVRVYIGETSLEFGASDVAQA